jgi:hypothetical protein
MNTLLCLVVYTANILGIFSDPFEFEGDYGDAVNPVRQKVFEAIVSKEALARNLTDNEMIELVGNHNRDANQIAEYRNHLISQAIQEDRGHGPRLSELVPSVFTDTLMTKQPELQGNGINTEDIKKIEAFLQRYGDQQIFYFLRHFPSQLLHLDKTLRDQAALAGKSFELPILSSTSKLEGKNSHELKMLLFNELFTESTFKFVKSENELKQYLSLISKVDVEQILGLGAEAKDLEAFCSPTGQVFFYWLYQAMNLQLVITDDNMIEQINRVKSIFGSTLGDPQNRAEKFKEKLIAADTGVLFTQESDAIVPRVLLESGLFLQVEKQNHLDGTLVFLRSDLWEPEYTIVPVDDYKGYAKGRLNVILATSITGEKYLLAAGHGNSTNAEDGRLQISHVKNKYDQLSKLPENIDLQLLIGIDANTKNEEDIQALREHLDFLGLVGTDVGPTTIKRRMVTAQHSKVGKFAVDEEDYLITLKPENGGRITFEEQTVGFKNERPDPTVPLPNLENPSDHYPVGAALKYL